MGEAAENPTTAVAPRGETAHTARMMLVVLGLAAGFVAIPRVTSSCSASHGTDVAADFTAKIVANPLTPGQTSFTLSQTKGHPVILDFWGTWCPACRSEAPVIDAIHRKYKDSGLVIVGIDVDDPPGLAEAYMEQHKLGYMTVYDEKSAIAGKYGVGMFPTMMVLDKDGKVVTVRRGAVSQGELERIIRALL